MPIYGILKRYIGEYLDLFVIVLLFTLGYYGILNFVIFKACIKTLLLFYIYKVYYIIFIRQYDDSKKYAFTGDLNRIVTNNYLKQNKGFIYMVYIICVLMPGNLFGYLLVTIVIKIKLTKVWFNGNKDIIFFKYFKYDIRPAFERYIIGYYDNIDNYVRIFIHEPFNRIIIIPTIIRNSLIHSSFFSILKARMFMFVFISILVFTGTYEYLNQSGYVGVGVIYVYFLLIGPRIVKMFNIEYIHIKGNFVSYSTPPTILFSFTLSTYYSVSSNCLSSFFLYLHKEKISDEFFLLYFRTIPRGYNNFFNIELINDKGDEVFVNVDRKLSAIMFGRYEKTYTSFICFKILLEEVKYKKAFIYYSSINNGFFGRHISLEESEEMKKFLHMYIRLYFLLLFSSFCFLNPDFENGEKYVLFYKEKYFKEKNIFDYENVTLEFFKKKELIISSENVMSEYIDISSIQRYKNMLNYVSFFKVYDEKFGKTGKFSTGLDLYIEQYDKAIQTNGIYKTTQYGAQFHEIVIDRKIVMGIIFQYEGDFIKSISAEHNELVEKNNTNDFFKWEDIEILIKIK